MSIVRAARDLDKANETKTRPENLEQIQTEIFLARGRVSDETLDNLQTQVERVALN